MKNVLIAIKWQSNKSSERQASYMAINCDLGQWYWLNSCSIELPAESGCVGIFYYGVIYILINL